MIHYYVQLTNQRFNCPTCVLLVLLVQGFGLLKRICRLELEEPKVPKE